MGIYKYISSFSKIYSRKFITKFPRFIGAAVEFLTPVLEGVVDAGKNFFDIFLKPIAEFTGGIIVDFIEGLTEKLTGFTDWANENKDIIEQVAFAIMSIGTGFLAFKGIEPILSGVFKILDFGWTILELIYTVIKVKLIPFITGTLAPAISGFVTTTLIPFIVAWAPFIAVAALVVAAILTVVWVIKRVAEEWKIITENWDEASAYVKEVFKQTVEKIKADVKEFVENIINKIAEFKQNITNKFDEIKNNISEKVQNMKDNVSNKFNDLKTNISNKVQEMKTNALNKFEDIKKGITDKINKAKEAVRTTIDKIKGFFKFEWSLPNIKTPHISWETQPASGWIAKTLDA